MIDRLVLAAASIARVARAILGVPDYERYLASVRECGCSCAPLTPEEFYKERMDAKYSRLGNRCC